MPLNSTQKFMKEMNLTLMMFSKSVMINMFVTIFHKIQIYQSTIFFSRKFSRVLVKQGK